MPRLPPSLKWLIDRRGRVAGELKKIERQLAKCQQAIDTYKQLDSDLAVLKQLLDSVDRTLALHEVQVEADLIPDIRSQEVHIRLPHGLLTRTILEYFRVAEKRIVPSEEITDYVLQRLEYLGHTEVTRSNLRKRLKYSLQRLYYRGHLSRHHDPRTQSCGLWSLVEHEFSLDIQSQDGAPGSTL